MVSTFLFFERLENKLGYLKKKKILTGIAHNVTCATLTYNTYCMPMLRSLRNFDPWLYRTNRTAGRFSGISEFLRKIFKLNIFFWKKRHSVIYKYNWVPEIRLHETWNYLRIDLNLFSVHEEINRTKNCDHSL